MADSRPERTGFRPERINFRPERADSRPERADFRPEKADLRPERTEFRPERAWGGTNRQTNERTKVPCVLQDFVFFGAAAQKRVKRQSKECMGLLMSAAAMLFFFPDPGDGVVRIVSKWLPWRF